MTNLLIKIVMIEKNSSSMHREYHEFYAVHVYLQSIHISLLSNSSKKWVSTRVVFDT